MARKGKVTAKLVGAQEVMKNLGAAGDRWKQAVKAALYLEASNIMGASQRRVPVDFGTLKNSGYVTLPVEQGKKILVELGYGGAGSKDYAIPQHERLDYNHPDGGSAKYLESVVDERSPAIAGNILALAKAHFESGRRGTPKGPMPTDPDTGEQLAAAKVIGKFLQSFGNPGKGRRKR